MLGIPNSSSQLFPCFPFSSFPEPVNQRSFPLSSLLSHERVETPPQTGRVFHYSSLPTHSCRGQHLPFRDLLSHTFFPFTCHHLSLLLHLSLRSESIVIAFLPSAPLPAFPQPSLIDTDVLDGFELRIVVPPHHQAVNILHRPS